MKIAPYFPSTDEAAEQMLRLGGLQPGERLFDLGSGDGRIVMLAAQRFGAIATGIELDADLVRQSRERIAVAGLDESQARIIEGDILTQDYSTADLVIAYLYPKAMHLLEPVLLKGLRPGARVVVSSFNFANWTPSEEMAMPDANIGVRTLYLYKR